MKDELPAVGNMCFGTNEKGTVWYKFQIGPLSGGSTAPGSPAGKLRFKIVPKDVIGLSNYDPFTDLGAISFGSLDFDFLLFDVTTQYQTGNSCSAIKNSTSFGTPGSVIKRCNWTGIRGPTGLFEPGTGIDVATGTAVRFNKPLPVNVGDIFYLAIDNFSPNSAGFLLDFRGLEAPDDSTAQLFSPDGISTTSNFIQGKVFQKLNNNCIKDTTETPLRSRIVKAMPGPHYAYTNALGDYTIYADTGNYQVSQVPTKLLGLLNLQYCPLGNTTHTANFGAANSTFEIGNDFADNVVKCPM